MIMIESIIAGMALGFIGWISKRALEWNDSRRKGLAYKAAWDACIKLMKEK